MKIIFVRLSFLFYFAFLAVQISNVAWAMDEAQLEESQKKKSDPSATPLIEEVEESDIERISPLGKEPGIEEDVEHLHFSQPLMPFKLGFEFQESIVF